MKTAELSLSASPAEVHLIYRFAFRGPILFRGAARKLLFAGKAINVRFKSNGSREQRRRRRMARLRAKRKHLPSNRRSGTYISEAELKQRNVGFERAAALSRSFVLARGD